MTDTSFQEKMFFRTNKTKSKKHAHYFFIAITATGRSYSGLGLPTTKYERILDLSTLSYKNSLGVRHPSKLLYTFFDYSTFAEAFSKRL